MSATRDRIWKELGAPAEQIGSVNDPRIREDFGRKWNEKWIYLDEDGRSIDKVVLWLRYDFVGAFTPDGSPIKLSED